MKYIEPIKSFILMCLVLLSLMFTFMIWSYKPNYPLTENPQIENIVLGQEKMKIEVVKPYRLMYTVNNELKGTASTAAIDNVMKEFKQFAVSNLQLESTNLSPERINEMVRMQNRMTLFFQTEVPIGVFGEMISFENNLHRQATFNRLIVDWASVTTTKELRLYFVSTSNNTVYKLTTLPTDLNAFNKAFIEPTNHFLPYSEIRRTGTHSIYVTSEAMDAMQYTYYGNEISPEVLKNVLFENPNIVQKAIEGTQEKYSDSMSILTLDTEVKTMNYVYPAEESSVVVSNDNLLTETIGFINEHGGFTADYRLSMMNTEAHVTEFQLYLQGYPVFSMHTSTRISAVWGENRIFRYRRPYYSLDTDITTEKNVRRLTPGVEVVQSINKYSELNLKDIDDLMVGYYLVQSENTHLFILEPSWFAVSDGNWTRLTLDTVGGYAYGLE